MTPDELNEQRMSFLGEGEANGSSVVGVALPHDETVTLIPVDELDDAVARTDSAFAAKPIVGGADRASSQLQRRASVRIASV